MSDELTSPEESSAPSVAALAEKELIRSQEDSAKKPFIGIGLESFPVNLAELIETDEVAYVKFNINVTGEAELLEDKNKRKQPPSKQDISSTDFDRTRANFVPRLRTYRIDSFVFLPMPIDVTHIDTIRYEDEKVGDLGDAAIVLATGNASGAISAIGKRLAQAFQGANFKPNPADPRSKNNVLQGIQSLSPEAMRMGRVAFNNKKEAAFSDVGRREFTFAYSFAPKSKEEADRLINLIKLFRYHSYPELLGGPGGGFYQFPSEFDITYMKGTKVNTALPRISTCVLSNISVNYTPNNGWMNLPNGFPPIINFTLRFNELETLDKRRIAEGF